MEKIKFSGLGGDRSIDGFRSEDNLGRIGKYFVNDKEIPKENLENYLVQELKNETTPTFTIRADENTKHKDVVFVMGIAETHQFNLAIATTQAEK